MLCSERSTSSTRALAVAKTAAAMSIECTAVLSAALGIGVALLRYRFSHSFIMPGSPPSTH